MKNLREQGNVFFLLCISLFAMQACSNSKKDVEQAKKVLMDSVNQANREAALKQNIIDSMSEVKAAAISRQETEQKTTVTNTSVSDSETKKKRMSKTTKGSLIGAGAGVLTGAAAGAILSKDKGKGAVVGGIVGGAVGSGIGYGAGAKKDNKVKRDTTR